MKRKLIILFTALVITVCVKAQTVITPKGTKITIDTSKWTLEGSNIYNKNSGNVGIGTNAPSAKLHVSNGDFRLENENNWNAYKGVTYSNTQYPQLFLMKARGTKASPSYPQTGNTMGVFKVANAVDSAGGAGFRVSSTETQTSAAHGSSISIFTTPNGSSGNADVFFINHDGKVGVGTTAPNASALMDMSSTASGVLVPRMTSAQRTAIASPANGLLVYDVTTNCFWVYKSSVWVQVISGAPTVSTKTANYTLTSEDNGSIIEFNSATGVTVTVPTGLPTGFQCSITQLGVGNVTVSGSGVTVKNAYNFTRTATQYSKIGIEIASTGIAILSGDAQ